MSNSSDHDVNPDASQFARGLRTELNLPPLLLITEPADEEDTSRVSEDDDGPSEDDASLSEDDDSSSEDDDTSSEDDDSSSEEDDSSSEEDDTSSRNDDTSSRNDDTSSRNDDTSSRNDDSSSETQGPSDDESKKKYGSAKARITSLKSKMTQEQWEYCELRFFDWEDLEIFSPSRAAEECEELADALEMKHNQAEKRRAFREKIEKLLLETASSLPKTLINDLALQLAELERLESGIVFGKLYQSALEESLRTLDAYVDAVECGRSFANCDSLPIEKESATWTEEKRILRCILACESDARNVAEYVVPILDSPDRIESFIFKIRKCGSAKAWKAFEGFAPLLNNSQTVMFCALLGDTPKTPFFRDVFPKESSESLVPAKLRLSVAIPLCPDACPVSLVKNKNFAVALLDSQELRSWLQRVGVPQDCEVGNFAKLVLSCATKERAAALLEQFEQLLKQNPKWKNDLAEAVMKSIPGGEDEAGANPSEPEYKEFWQWCWKPEGLNASHQILSGKFNDMKSRGQSQDWRDGKVAADQLIGLLKSGANPNAFDNKGINTSKNNRSLLHQLVENQSRLTPSSSSTGDNLEEQKSYEESLGELIRQLQSQDCDIIPYGEIKESTLVTRVKQQLLDSGEQPVLFYGFEAMRTPYVEATKEGAAKDSRASQDALRMWDLWEFAKRIKESHIDLAAELTGLGGACREVVAQCESQDWQDVQKYVVASPTSWEERRVMSGTNKYCRAAQYLDFLGRKKAKSKLESETSDFEVTLLPTTRESKAMNIDSEARGSTRRCKLGLDWVCEQKGRIASLLDGIDFDEILEYGERKLAKMFGDGAESFEKTITFSEIRHVLRNFDQFCPESGHQTVIFYRKGKPLTRDAIQEMRAKFKDRSKAARERKNQARAALAILEKCKALEDFMRALTEHQKSLEAVAIGVTNYLNWLQTNGSSLTTQKKSEIKDSLKSNVKARNLRIDLAIAECGIDD